MRALTVLRLGRILAEHGGPMHQRPPSAARRYLELSQARGIAKRVIPSRIMAMERRGLMGWKEANQNDSA